MVFFALLTSQCAIFAHKFTILLKELSKDCFTMLNQNTVYGLELVQSLGR